MNLTPSLFLRPLTARWPIVLFNLCFAWVTCKAIWIMVLDLAAGTANAAEMELIVEGTAVLCVTFGVALESRRDLMSMLGLYPALETPVQERVDQVCHDLGLTLLLLGLGMEIPVQAVRIPNHILDTSAFEVETLAVATFFLFLAMVAGLLACLRLVRLPERRAGAMDHR
jgi:hypothetical protein